MLTQNETKPKESQIDKSSSSASNGVAKEEQNKHQNSKEGLLKISDPKEDKEVKGNIIFVHGLDGDRSLTWDHRTKEQRYFDSIERCLSEYKESPQKNWFLELRKWLFIKRQHERESHKQLKEGKLPSKNSPKKGKYWPEWLAEEKGLSDFDVWLFGYQTKKFSIQSKPSASSLNDIAKFLITEIVSKKLEKKPLIFITHSLGGLVVKAMLKVADNKRYLSILQNTKGVVFIATPHNGSDLAILSKDVKFKYLFNPVIKELTPNEDRLKELTNFYQQQSEDLGIVTLAFYEMYDMLGFTVVDRDSANPEIRQDFPEPINKDHVSIAKCESTEDILYKVVKQFLIDYDNKLQKIKDREEDHFKKVSQSLRDGNLIFFIGSGITSPDNEKTVLSDKTKEVIKPYKLPPSDQEIAHELTIKSHLNTDEIVGSPCQICPMKPQDRPMDTVDEDKEEHREQPLCPVMQKIDKKRNINQQLIDEQNLAFAKLQIRCHGQFIKEINGSIDKILQTLYRKHYKFNELQKLLVEIVYWNRKKRDAFPLMITTNYDCGIEQALEEIGQESLESFDVLYYSGDYTLEKGYITRANPNWKLISYQYQTETNGTKKFKINDIKRLKRGDIESKYIDEDTLKKHPVLIKLCGGEIYKVSESQWKFAISGINSIKDFATTKLLSTLVMTNFCRTNDILFFGYSATDSELQDLLDTLVPPIIGREYNSQGWLINQSDIGELNNQIANYWYNWHVEIDHNYPWKNYLKELHKIESESQKKKNNDE